MTIQSIGFTKQGIGHLHLVRGIGKRAINVVLRPTHSSHGYANEIYVIKLAAEYAAKRGWKTIYAEPDQIDCDTVRVFNTHQYFIDSNNKGYPGKFICYQDSTGFESDFDEEMNNHWGMYGD